MNKLFLEAYIESFSNFETAMNGLLKSHEHCTSIGIKSDYSFEETEAFDALIIKLTRNSDVFFQQLVKAYFKLKGEDILMFIDRLYMLEKIGVIDNVDQLMVLKSFRNQAVYEYSTVAFQELYQEALELSPFFITTVQQFKVFLITENILKC